MDNSNNNNNSNNGQTNPQQSDQTQQPSNASSPGTWSGQQDQFSYDVFKGNEPRDNKKENKR
jgi:hypothetical protein